MFEHHKQPLANKEIFLRRMLKYAGIAIAIAGASLFIGMLGYHYIENLSWIDSLLNSSMILSGMGPVATLKTSAGKLFASLYALFSGMIFLAVVGIIITPVAHRFLHIFHVETVRESVAKSTEKAVTKAATRTTKAGHKNHKNNDSKDHDKHHQKSLLDF